MLATRYPLLTTRLRSYFFSGWAFLIPYLAVYLLYYVTKWPVNASRLMENGELRMQNGWVPCMLHVYWTLHAVHVILAGFALWSWWRKQKAEAGCQTPDEAAGEALCVKRFPTPASGLWPLASQIAPWLLLALLFYIPGVYLEWPSDPWEHLRRINEWRILDTVGAHSSWMKSAYFIPYSMLSWCIGLRQLFWLDFYYTGICLLLCWQYYRFSRACGLGERSSMVFVIIQALLFGNNIFSFYRYYGISSSIYAQLGAIALTRIVLQFAARGTKLEKTERQVREKDIERREDTSTPTHLQSLPILPTSTPSALPLFPSSPLPQTDTPLAYNSGLRALCVRAVSTLLKTQSLCRGALSRTSETDPAVTGFWHLPSLALLLSSSLALLLLTALNHPQGLGIAGLGIAAIIVWRLIEWKRSALWWLIGGTLIINALFLALYPRPAIIETYRAQGYLNAWYGFNLLDLTSPAGDRMLQIVSAFGLINLTAALFLLRRKNLIAWLTVMPFLILLLPCVSITLTEALYKSGDVMNIVTFQRMLFAIPFGLVLVHFGTLVGFKPAPNPDNCHQRSAGIRTYAIALFSIGLLSTVTGSSPSFNRTWQSNVSIPDDLQLQDYISQYQTTKLQLQNRRETTIVTNQAGTALLSCEPNAIAPNRSRTIGRTPLEVIISTLNEMGYDKKDTPIPHLDPIVLHTQTLPPPIKYSSKSIQRENSIAAIDTENPALWNTLSGASMEFATNTSTLPFFHSAVQNPAGATCEVFTSTLIPVHQLKSYRLEMTIRQPTNTEGTAYLAVAWYGADKKLLIAYEAQPLGAGTPRGWSNGTYSYFGLISQIPPQKWTAFEISFGLRESAIIPPNAYYIRVGSLLNYNKTPAAIIQLAEVRLYEKPTPDISTALPQAGGSYTPISQAAQLSTHWPPHQSIFDRSGINEIQAADKTMRKILDGTH